MNFVKNINSSLNKNHIDKILNNCNIKYNRFKNEIDFKINELIKEFFADILSFLENVQESTLLKIKSKEISQKTNEVEYLLKKLRTKEIIENNLREEIRHLFNENKDLKHKIKNQRRGKFIKNEEKNAKYFSYSHLEKNKLINSKKKRSFTELNKNLSQSFNGVIHKKQIENKIKNNDRNKSQSIFSKNTEVKNGSQLIYNYSNLIKENNKKETLDINKNHFFKKINMSEYYKNLNNEKERKKYHSEEKNIKKIIDDYNKILNEEISILQNQEEDILQLLNTNSNNHNQSFIK